MTATVEIPAPKLPTLYRKQREAITCPSRYTLIEASTKSGKTAGCLVWMLAKAWNEGQDNRNFWWVAPIIPVAKIAFRRLRRMLRQFDPHKRSWQANETESRIDLMNGASIWFKGADDPDSLYGEDVYGAVIDEATRCKEEAWHAVRSTLTATRGPIKIIGNVRGRKNWAYKLARKAEAGEIGMSYFKLTAMDAVEGGILAAEEVEDARRTLPPDVFNELYLAQPADDGGNPFGIQAIHDCLAPLSSKPAKCYGVDLAKSVDWTVILGLDEDCRCCHLERWRSDWGQTKEKLVRTIGNMPALIDSTGVGDPIVEDIQRSCYAVQGFKFTSQSKQQIMEGLATGIQRKEISFPEGWLSSELESFEYEYRQGGVRYSAPEGMHDDGVCALALARSKFTQPQASVDSGFYVLTAGR